MEFARPNLVEEFYPMGLWLRVETDAPEVLATARESFARFPPTARRNDSPDVELRLLVNNVDDELKPDARPPALFRLQGDYFYITAGRDATVIGDLVRRRVVGFVPRSIFHGADYLRHNFIEASFYGIL